MSRCCSRRCCSRTRSWACSCSPSSGCASSRRTTFGSWRSTRASPPRPWPTRTRPSACARSRPPSSRRSAASASCSRSPNRSSRRSTRPCYWARSRTGSGSSSAPTTWRSSSSTGFAAGSRRSSPAASMPRTTCRPGIPARPAPATWVLEHNEPVRVDDEFDDERVLQPETGPIHGSLVSCRSVAREGAIGVLTLERIGEGRVFSDDEFELVQLFAAQASIALQNAEVHVAVSQRAQIDVLTGLLNHGTFRQHRGPHRRGRDVQPGDARPRPVQAGERRHGPPGRRPAVGAGRGHERRGEPRQRPRVPLRRRRVRRAAATHGRRPRGTRCRAHPGSSEGRRRPGLHLAWPRPIPGSVRRDRLLPGGRRRLR